MLYRTNPSLAAEIAKSLMPEEIALKICLDFLVDSINIAHALSPDRWGITLTKDMIRLNVGAIEVVSLFSEVFHCTLDLDTIPKDLWDDNAIRLGKNEHDPEAGIYSRVPKSVACDIDIEIAQKTLPLIKTSHRVLVENASQTGRHSMTKKAHSPAVIDYLSFYLGRDVPKPRY